MTEIYSVQSTNVPHSFSDYTDYTIETPVRCDCYYAEISGSPTDPSFPFTTNLGEQSVVYLDISQIRANNRFRVDGYQRGEDGKLRKVAEKEGPAIFLFTATVISLDPVSQCSQFFDSFQLKA